MHGPGVDEYSRIEDPFGIQSIVNLIERQSNNRQTQDSMEIVLGRTVASHERHLEGVDDKTQAYLQHVEDEECKTDFLVFVIEVLAWDNIHRLVCKRPSGKDDGSRDEQLDECVWPEPASCECPQITADERTEWQEDKETNRTKNGMSLDLQVKTNELARREVDGLYAVHLES